VFDADVFVLHRFGLLGRVDEQRAEFARLVDLLFAVEVGIILTAILLMKRMADVAEIQN